MAQYTALEWFYEETIIKGKTNYFDLFQQAKTMEKEQIINACVKFGNNNGVDIDDYEEYYNENYGK